MSAGRWVLKRAAGADRGATLVELVTALAIAALVTGSLYLLLGASIRGRLVVEARITDQEWGRQALEALVERVRQVNYDASAPCPEGFVRLGTGDGFAQRLAFRAVLDPRLDPPRRTYVYYAEGRQLWQENRVQEYAPQCFEEDARGGPAPDRVALTPPVIERIVLTPLGRAGFPVSAPERVRAIQIVLTVGAAGASGRAELQTYRTLATVRGP